MRPPRLGFRRAEEAERRVRHLETATSEAQRQIDQAKQRQQEAQQEAGELKRCVAGAGGERDGHGWSLNASNTKLPTVQEAQIDISPMLLGLTEAVRGVVFVTQAVLLAGGPCG